MKKINKFFKTFVSMIIIFTLCVGTVYAHPNAVQSINIEDDERCLGKIIPLEKANDAFADKIDYESLDEVEFEKAISINKDNISVSLSLFMDSTEIKLQYDGKLYKSFRYKDEAPVYIAIFENDSAADIEVIYFEISNGSSLYNLNKDLRELSSITMYLRDEEGAIYDLGCELDNPVVLGNVDNQAPSENDIDWFIRYFEGTHNEEQSNSTRSTYGRTWYGDTHTLTYQIAGYEHLYTAKPYVDLSYGDVDGAGDTKFKAALKIYENHKYRVVGASNWTLNTGDYSRCFAIDNVQMAWTAGGNTVITYVSWNLNTTKQGGGNHQFAGLASTITGVFPQTATLSTILSVANAIWSSSFNISQNLNNNSGMDAGGVNNIKSFKMKFPTNYYIEDSGVGISNVLAERFELVAEMSTDDSENEPENYATYAIAGLKFRLGWAGMDGQSGSKNYTVNKEVAYITNYK